MWIVLKLRLGVDLNGLGIETHNITSLPYRQIPCM